MITIPSIMILHTTKNTSILFGNQSVNALIVPMVGTHHDLWSENF